MSPKTNDTIKAITDFIFVENEPRKADYIFIPGGSYPELGEKAAELWKKGYAPFVFASGGVSLKTGKFPGPKTKREIYDGAYRTEFEFLSDVLVKNGVAADCILGEDGSGFTKQNAQFTRQTLDELGRKAKSAIITCKAFHARRCLMCYELYFPDTELFVVPIDPADVLDAGITRDNWHRSEYGIRRVMGELSRCGQQFTEDWITDRIPHSTESAL